MAITAYTGLPGSGKSYGVVEYVILPALKKGKRVVTNIPLNAELIDAEFPDQVHQFKTEDILDSSTWFQEDFIPGATIIIDECWRLWPSGIRANNMVEGHKSFLAEHRHMVGQDGNSTEIVLVTQDLQQIASYPRGLVESTYRTVKLVAVGAPNRFRVDIYQGPVTGPNPPEKQRLRQIQGKYDPEIYKYYTSQTMNQGDEHGDETRTDDRTNILKSPFIRFGIPAIVGLAAVFIFYGAGEVSDMYSGEADQEPAQEVQEPDPQPIPTTIPPPPPKVQHFYDGMKAYIVWNMGHIRSRIKFRIAFESGDSRTVLNEKQLTWLGYSLNPINECMVGIEGKGATRWVYCQDSAPSKNDGLTLSF